MVNTTVGRTKHASDSFVFLGHGGKEQAPLLRTLRCCERCHLPVLDTIRHADNFLLLFFWQVLELASERVFVPLTVGGGIRSHTDDSGKVRQVAGRPTERLLSVPWNDTPGTYRQYDTAVAML